jgi:hypothetical protein
MTTSEKDSNGAHKASPIALPTDWEKQPKRPVGRMRKTVLRTARRALPTRAYSATRETYRSARRVARLSPGSGRLLPDYLIIGVVKGGSTTLCAWVNAHPFVVPAAKKEVHYFDYQYSFGEDWYRSNFPRERDRTRFDRQHGRPFLTGEASPSYISHAYSPARIAQDLPDIKMLVALRNPVDRAYSHYQMSRRAGEEPIDSFVEAVQAEEERLQPELDRVDADPSYFSGKLGGWSYLLRGRYAEQLERWFELFPREQFHFVKTEDLTVNPAPTLAGIYRFLDLPEYEPQEFQPFHVAAYDAIPDGASAMLAEYFRPHNERLYALLGVDFGWEAELEQRSELHA